MSPRATADGPHLQPLICKVDAQLREAIDLERLEAEDVQHAYDTFIASLAFYMPFGVAGDPPQRVDAAQ